MAIMFGEEHSAVIESNLVITPPHPNEKCMISFNILSFYSMVVLVAGVLVFAHYTLSDNCLALK